MPLFVVAGDGRYEVQPVSVRDTASICVDAGEADEDVVVDAAGPVRWSFDDFVRLIARAVRSHAWIAHARPSVTLLVGRVAGAALRDVLLTRDELGALMAGLLVSDEPARGTDRFDVWLRDNGDRVGRRYASEVARNFTS